MEEQTDIKEVVQETTQPEQKSSYEQNIISMRKKLEAEEEARQAAERRLQEMERKLQSIQPQTGNTHTDDDDLSGDPDDYLQVKQFKKNTSKLSSKISEAERRYQELNDKIERIEAQSALKDLKDFDDVVNDDSIKNLARLYPEDYETVMANPNLKNKSKTVYNMIKNYGLYSKGLKESDDKVSKNKSKPGNPASGQTPNTPLSKLNDYDRRVMTEEDRARILARLEQIKRGG